MTELDTTHEAEPATSTELVSVDEPTEATPTEYSPALHWRVAIGHRVSQLTPESRTRLHGAPMTVLALLWGRARDPFDPGPCVIESYGSLVDCTGYAERTVARAIQELAAQSFLVLVDRRPGVGSIYRLLRPSIAADIALVLARRNPYEPRVDVGAAELVSALRRETQRMDGKKTKRKKDGPSVAQQREQRRDTLQRLRVSRRDVALVLEYGDAIPAGVEPRLAYSGKGAHAVNEAIDYLLGRSWVDLLEVVRTAERIGVPRGKCLLAKYRKKVIAAMDGEAVVEIESVGVPPAVQASTLPEIPDELRAQFPDATDDQLREFFDVWGTP